MSGEAYFWLLFLSSHLFTAIAVMAVDVGLMERARERKRSARERSALASLGVDPGELISLALAAGASLPFRVCIRGVVWGFPSRFAGSAWVSALSSAVEHGEREPAPRDFGGVLLSHPSIAGS